MRDVPNGWLIRYIHANGASMCAGKTRCKVFFYLKHIDWHYFFLVLSLEACYRDVRSCLDMNQYHQFSFTPTMGGGVKRLNIVVKTSANYPKALIGVASGLDRASIFLNRSPLIFKRLGFYILASNCIKPVRTIHRTTSTYTFNYCYLNGSIVNGEIGKKTLLTRGTRLNNILAPKIRDFSTKMSQSGVLVPVKIDKSEHLSLTGLVFDKFCSVSLDTILFIEKMNKIEDNRSTLYKVAFSTDSLLAAYDQIKSKPGNLTPGQRKETLRGISLRWFRATSNKLLKGLFIYPKMRRVSIPKNLGSTNSRLLTLTSPRIKIIERSILNAIEPKFEGNSKWKIISKAEYDFIKKSNNNIIVTSNKAGYFKKYWINPPVFNRFSFGFRPSRSAHGALNVIKGWPVNLSWFVKFDIVKAFDTVNRNRLKNIFTKYCPDYRIWGEVNKLMKAEIVGLKINSCDDLGVSQRSVLSPFLLNVYMTELDKFIEVLQAKYSVTDPASGWNPSVRNKYEKFVRKFRTKTGLGRTLKECGSPEIVLALYKKERSQFYKEYGSTRGENKNLRCIKYVRYADDFVLGIRGSRDFALKIAMKIETFIKSNLRLKVHDVFLTSRDKGAVEFLGFKVYLSSIKNKARTKSNKIKSIAKYKRRSIARLQGSNARISQAYFNSIKHGFLNYLQNMYEKLNLKKDKNIDLALVQHFTNQNLKDILQNSSQLSNASDTNLALRRFTQHFKDLFSKNIAISLEVWEENFKELELFKKNFTLTTELSRVIEAREKFLAELKAIESSVKDKAREKAKTEAIEFYQKKQSLKVLNKSPFSKFSEREFARTAELLSLSTMDITRSRRISIRFDIKNFYSKLADLGFYSAKRNAPLSVPKLVFLNDYEIINFYNTLIRGYMNWFRCADNFTSAKNIIWTLRMSCLKTLARKHKKNLKWALNVFTINVSVDLPNGSNFSLPSVHEISQMSHKFLLENTYQEPDPESLFNKYSLRLHSSRFLFSRCAVRNCCNTDIEIHYVKKLSRRIDSSGKISVLTSNNKRLYGLSALLSAVNRKQLPLCSLHHLKFEAGEYSPLDPEFFKKVYNIDCSGLNFEEIFLGK